MPLTDKAVRSAKPSAKLYKLSDGGGLQLWVDPRGYRLWRLAYRFDGKQRALALGPYPKLSLAEARRSHEKARALIKDGVDPSVDRRVQRSTRRVAAANTFGAIADELIARKEKQGRAAATLDKAKWLSGLACAKLGKRPISDIRPPEVLDVLKVTEQRGRPDAARRLRAFIGQVFRHAIATARAENDPTSALRDALLPPKVKHRAAIRDPAELGSFLRAVEGYMGQSETKAALRLLPLVYTRPGELTQAEWAEFDLDKAVWSVPASREKMRRGFDVPLARQAVAILRELQGLTGHRRLVFPGMRSPERPISENTLNAAMRRLGYGQDEVTAHGFRSTASTLLNESKRWSIDAIERSLNHVEGNAVRRAYDRSRHWEERVRMAQWWADHLDELRLSDANALNAVALHRAQGN
jgi:integrase